MSHRLPLLLIVDLLLVHGFRLRPLVTKVGQALLDPDLRGIDGVVDAFKFDDCCCDEPDCRSKSPYRRRDGARNGHHRRCLDYGRPNTDNKRAEGDPDGDPEVFNPVRQFFQCRTELDREILEPIEALFLRRYYRLVRFGTTTGPFGVGFQLFLRNTLSDGTDRITNLLAPRFGIPFQLVRIAGVVQKLLDFSPKIVDLLFEILDTFLDGFDKMFQETRNPTKDIVYRPEDLLEFGFDVISFRDCLVDGRAHDSSSNSCFNRSSFSAKSLSARSYSSPTLISAPARS